MKRANRMLTIVVFGVFVTVGWSLFSHTEWAAAREYLGAGLDFDSWADPFVVFGAMTAVAVASTRLVESAWRVLFPRRSRQSPVASKRRASAPGLPEALRS